MAEDDMWWLDQTQPGENAEAGIPGASLVTRLICTASVAALEVSEDVFALQLLSLSAL